METTQPSLREQPAQIIVPNISQPQIQTEPVISQAASEQQPEQTVPEPAKPLYNPAEVEQIVGHLTSGIFDPEYILLFGKLVGGTRFSDPMAYDLLMVVRETPSYDWIQAKRYLRYQMPLRHREITYINIYILPLNYIEGNNSPFLYFTHNEGKLIYCKDRHYFHPKKSCNFAAAYCDARFHFDTFSELGMLYLEKAYSEYAEGHNLRPAALFTAQAAVYFYHTLYYVFHGYEFDIHDPVVMHERMRTLSAELMLVLDDNHIDYNFTLPCLKGFMQKAAYNLNFDVAPKELEMHMARVEKMGDIIQRLCEMRLELYEERRE